MTHTSPETAAAILQTRLYAESVWHPHGAALRALAAEIRERGQALGLRPVVATVRTEEFLLAAAVEFDMHDEDGQPWIQELSVPLEG